MIVNLVEPWKNFTGFIEELFQTFHLSVFFSFYYRLPFAQVLPDAGAGVRCVSAWLALTVCSMSSLFGRKINMIKHLSIGRDWINMVCE